MATPFQIGYCFVLPDFKENQAGVAIAFFNLQLPMGHARKPQRDITNFLKMLSYPRPDLHLLIYTR